MENEMNVEAQEEQVNTAEVPSEEEEAGFAVGGNVKGTVVHVSENEVLVDIGYKTEAVLPLQETSVRSDQQLSDHFQQGQELELTVKKYDSTEDKIILSHKALMRKKKWSDLQKSLDEGEVLTGKVKEAVQAGLVVDIGDGFDGFMPGSLVDIRYVPDFNEFVGQEITFKIIELHKEREKVILSRKEVLEKEMAAEKEETLGKLKPGQVIKGTVKRLTDFGAFVDVGGIDGLVHISEIAWYRVEHPSEALNVGDNIDVKVIEVIPERERIGLSYRQTQEDPWSEVARKFSPGTIVEGKVTRLVNFGVFVELIPGVEGLVHISQMANYHVNQPSEVTAQGETVKVKILDINPDGKRVSLSMREAEGEGSSKKGAVLNATQEDDSSGVTLGDVFGDLFNTGGEKEEK